MLVTDLFLTFNTGNATLIAMYKPRSLANAVDKVARQAAGKDWGLYASLLDHWVEIVGAEYARVTTPVKILFPYQPQMDRRKNGVLTVRLPKGLAMEFSFKADLIRQRVNTYFGYEAFSRVALDAAASPISVVRQRVPVEPAALAQVKQQVSNVDNCELRDALEKFGAALLARHDERS